MLQGAPEHRLRGAIVRFDGNDDDDDDDAYYINTFLYFQIHNLRSRALRSTQRILQLYREILLLQQLRKRYSLSLFCKSPVLHVRQLALHGINVR